MVSANVLPHDDRGGGDPVVLLHGYPLNRSIWASQLDAFQATNRVIALDLPGFGQANALPTPEDIWTLGDQVSASIADLASPPAVLVGHSFGGYLALQIAQDHPERVRALVLVSTRSEADTDEARAKRLATISRLRGEGPGPYSVETARALLSPTHAVDAELFPKVLAAVRSAPVSAMVPTLLAMANRPDYSEFAATLKVPTLVVWGEEDRTIAPETTKKLIQQIPKAKGAPIAKAGHLPFLENPTVFNQAVQAFLSSLPPPAKVEKTDVA